MVPEAGELVSQLLGWSYFLAWSASFIPQLVLNHQRKSTVGFSPDFATSNPLGYLALALFNTPLLLSHAVRAQYARRHRGLAPAVSGADVTFALYALTMASACYGQTWLYPAPRSVQRLSRYNQLALPLLGLAIASWGLYVLLTPGRETLDWLLGFSYIKLYITFTKYLPQATLNARRRSTAGWSITNIALDLTGAVGSLAQLGWDGWRAGRAGGTSPPPPPAAAAAAAAAAAGGGGWEGVREAIGGNPSKLGMALFTLSFDLVFIGQHLAWGRNAKDEPRADAPPAPAAAAADTDGQLADEEEEEEEEEEQQQQQEAVRREASELQGAQDEEAGGDGVVDERTPLRSVVGGRVP